MARRDFHRIFAKPIIFVGVLILMTGAFCYTQMHSDIFPDVLFPRITILADAGSQPVDRMMITVTKPLESAVKKVRHVTTVKSSTSRGSCGIDVFFEWGTDPYQMKSEVESRINEIKGYMPDVALSTEVQNPCLYPVVGYTLGSKTHSAIELRDVGILLARPIFARVPGVSNVVLIGGKEKEYVVIPDPAAMMRLGVTPSQIVDAFSNTNFVEENGMVNAYNRIYLTITDTRIEDASQLADVVIRNDGSRPIRVSDIAKVEIQEQKQFYKVNANGAEVVQIDLIKQPGVDLITFARDAEKQAQQIRRMLPKGYELNNYYDQSLFVGESIHSVMKTILEGLLLALAVMIIFLRSWRASAVVLFTIPVTIAFSILLVYLAGLTINVMSLGAIAASVGLIIDDAIVVIEQIYRSHEENPAADRFAVVRKSIAYLFPAMVASSLATIVIFFPFALMSGMAGNFFRELSLTMQITLVVSFLVTWLLLPALHLMFGYRESLRSKAKRIDRSESAVVGKVHWLTTLFKKPLVAVGVVTLLVTTALFAYSRLETDFLPELDEGSIVLDYHTPPGTSLEETDRVCQQLEKILMDDPRIEAYSRRTAFGIGFHIRPTNFGDYSIKLRKNCGKTTPEMMSELRKTISEQVPVLTIEFGQKLSDVMGDLRSVPQPIEVKIFGNDYNVLQHLAEKAQVIMEKVPGIADLDNGLVAAGPSLSFKPDIERLSQFGVTLTDFQQQLAAHTGGISLSQSRNVVEATPAQAALTTGLQIGTIQDGEQMRRILMRFTPFEENSVEKIMAQPVFLPDGTTRPVSFFAKIDVVPGEIEETREDLKNNITLTARLDGRDLGSAVEEIKQGFKKELSLPRGYSISYGGAYAEQQQSFTELMMILGLAVLLVFGILMFIFREWLVSLAVLFVSVVGMSGCVIALWLSGVPLNVSSYTGIIMIVGIIAENSIFTVHQYRMNRRLGEGVEDSVNY
ncbi:MAG: efflux RND transporter permease subunit, partial [Acidobacteriaceae bacterium]|nr:efflux RND transporter permease subunit [Acidobacteriaceae bacterium]